MQTEIKKPLGVIEVLSSGFELVLQNPWAIILPIALDLLVWLGPQISVKPLFDNLIAVFSANAALTANASADTVQSFDMIKNALQVAGDTFNLFGVIATGVPTLFWIEPPVAEGVRSVWFITENVLTLLGALVPLAIVAILITSLYFELIARAVRKEGNPKTFGAGVARGFGTIFFLVMILLLALIGFMIPVSLVATLLSFVSQALASFAMLLASLMILWVTLYLAFVLPSIFISGANPLQAIFNSISLFRFDFWSSMGLVILTYLIRWGFAFVWQFFIDNPAGIVFDVIANAFLGTGLTAAMLVYYADRMNWLNQLRERIRQHVQIKG